MTAPTPAPDLAGLVERLEGGPHEWGYRCPVEGGFIRDDTPFEAAARIRDLEAENARLAVLVKDRIDAHEFRYGTEETPWTTEARAALSGRGRG